MASTCVPRGIPAPGGTTTALTTRESASAAVVPFAGVEKSGAFAEAIMAILTDASFAALTDMAVPPPRPDETEDEYVERAKKTVGDLISAKLSGADRHWRQ